MVSGKPPFPKPKQPGLVASNSNNTMGEEGPDSGVKRKIDMSLDDVIKHDVKKQKPNPKGKAKMAPKKKAKAKTPAKGKITLKPAPVKLTSAKVVAVDEAAEAGRRALAAAKANAKSSSYAHHGKGKHTSGKSNYKSGKGMGKGGHVEEDPYYHHYDHGKGHHYPPYDKGHGKGHDPYYSPPHDPHYHSPEPPHYPPHHHHYHPPPHPDYHYHGHHYHHHHHHAPHYDHYHGHHHHHYPHHPPPHHYHYHPHSHPPSPPGQFYDDDDPYERRRREPKLVVREYTDQSSRSSDYYGDSTAAGALSDRHDRGAPAGALSDRFDRIPRKQPDPRREKSRERRQTPERREPERRRPHAGDPFGLGPTKLEPEVSRGIKPKRHDSPIRNTKPPTKTNAEARAAGSIDAVKARRPHDKFISGPPPKHEPRRGRDSRSDDSLPRQRRVTRADKEEKGKALTKKIMSRVRSRSASSSSISSWDSFDEQEEQRKREAASKTRTKDQRRQRSRSPPARKVIKERSRSRSPPKKQEIKAVPPSPKQPNTKPKEKEAGQMFVLQVTNVPMDLSAVDLHEAFTQQASRGSVITVDTYACNQGTKDCIRAEVRVTNLADAKNLRRRFHGGDLNGKVIRIEIQGPFARDC